MTRSASEVLVAPPGPASHGDVQQGQAQQGQAQQGQAQQGQAQQGQAQQGQAQQGQAQQGQAQQGQAQQGQAQQAARSLRKDAARNRERLLVAANEVFAEKGLDACLTEVADRAGVGMGTVYRRFADKEALVAALLDAKLDEITQTASGAAREPTGWAAFCALLIRMSELLVEDHGLAELMLSEHGQRHGQAQLAPYRSIAAAIVARAQAEGSLRSDFTPTDISPLLNMTAAAADFTAPLGRTVWPRYLQVLLDGLRAGPEHQVLAPAPLSHEELSSATRSSWRRTASKRPASTNDSLTTGATTSSNDGEDI